jgi:N6-adenosine-specific RNA methylase IME4
MISESSWPLLSASTEILSRLWRRSNLWLNWILLLADRDCFTGLGFWTRANPEPCLLATRGQPKRSAGDVPKLLIAPRREHSRKPEETYARIERLLPGPYLELFARQSRPGWDGFGDQEGLFDRGPVLTRRRPSRAS